MFSYMMRRLLILIPLLFVISFVVYLGVALTPGDPVSYMIGPEAMQHLRPEELEKLKDALGLNRPIIVRFFYWFWGVLRGNFGYSLLDLLRQEDGDRA